MTYRIFTLAYPFVLGTVLLSACGGGDSDPGGADDSNPSSELRVLTVDASHDDEYVFLNLVTGQPVPLTEEQAQSSTEWHVALRRYNIRLNGGASGPGAVAAALVAPQSDFYENGEPVASRFFNATAASELDVLMTDFDEPSSGSWVSDGVETVLRGTSATSDDGWYIYDDFVNGHMSPNSNNGWLIRSGEGDSYARMRMTGLTFRTRVGVGIEHLRVEFDVQPAGATEFTSTAVFEAGGGVDSGDPAIPPGGGELCFDFDADETVACAGTAWDVKIGFLGQSLYMRSNGGVSGEGDGAAFGRFDWADLEQYARATHDPDGNTLTALYQQDRFGGIFSTQSWYAYGLGVGHQLWPNYRVYLIDTDTDDSDSPRYAFQVLGYYNDAGTSGHVSLRYRLVDAE